MKFLKWLAISLIGLVYAFFEWIGGLDYLAEKRED